MDIPLLFDEAGKLFLYAQVFSPGIPRPKPLRMHLDTGASSTTLSLKDAEELGVDAGSLRPSGRTNYGYGGRMDVRRLPEACLVFLTVDRTAFTVPLDSVQVNCTFSAVRGKGKDLVVYGMPSVLGVDLLLKAGMGLSASWKDRTARLSA
ncbi:MAG: hypothetical protein FJ149_00600 [Euryarchaeota archaeon]|nr:hypothetical protein [Euryarchaeota archaeon]